MSSRLLILLVLALASCASLVTSSSTAAGAPVSSKPIEVSAPQDGTPRLGLSPIRFDPQTAEPGAELHYNLLVTNTTSTALRLSPFTLPLEGSDDPGAYAQAAGKHSFSATATTWVSYPGFGAARALDALRGLWFPVRIRIPNDARPGTYSLGIAMTQTVTSPGLSTTDSSRVRLNLSPASTIVIRVAGEATAEARIRNLEAPRIVWGGEPTFVVRLENTGDTDLTLDGQVTLGSFLSSARRTLDAAGPDTGFPTLPGGTRELRMRWNDPPLAGWFEPELVVVGGTGSGVRISDDLDTVYVIPPWWLVLALVIALWLPLRIRRRRRRDPLREEAERERAKDRVKQRMLRDEAKRRAAAARRRR